MRYKYASETCVAGCRGTAELNAMSNSDAPLRAVSTLQGESGFFIPSRNIDRTT